MAQKNHLRWHKKISSEMAEKISSEMHKKSSDMATNLSKSWDDVAGRH